jgi:hypothetical protein
MTDEEELEGDDEEEGEFLSKSVKYSSFSPNKLRVVSCRRSTLKKRFSGNGCGGAGGGGGGGIVCGGAAF